MVVKVKIVVITWQCIDFPVLLMSMLSRTPAMSFITHSFGSDAPTARPSSWLSQVTRTREKHKSGSDELPWRYRTFFVFEFTSFTPRRVGSIRDKFAMFPTLSWMKATIRFKYLWSKNYTNYQTKKEKRKRDLLYIGWLVVKQDFWKLEPAIVGTRWCAIGGLTDGHNTHKTHTQTKPSYDVLQWQVTNSRFSVKGFYAWSLREQIEHGMG